MGYTLELGYPSKIIEHEGGWKEIKGFETARVKPVRVGSTLALDPETPQINDELDISPWEAGGDTLDMEQYREMPMAVDDGGKAPAVMDITFNYSNRIGEVTGGHLGDLHAQKASEGAAMLMELIAGLKPEDGDTEDYWQPTDGNIKNLAEALLGWTFEHPDAVFYYVI